MKLKKEKNLENENKAKAAENTTMKELDDDALEEVTGAGNPFANISRVPTQRIDSNLRNKG